MKSLVLALLAWSCAARAQVAVEAPRAQVAVDALTPAAGAAATAALPAPSIPLALPPPASAVSFVPSAAPTTAHAAAVLAAPGPAAPDLKGLEAVTRALIARYLPELYRPIAVRYGYEESNLGPGGGHTFTPESGHEITLTPAEPDPDGLVLSAIGPPGETRVQPKIEQIVTSVHEFAHALFDDAIGRRDAARPRDSSYDAMTEGFAVQCERLVLRGMLRDAAELGLSERDAADARRLLDARLRWLKSEDNAYAEGTPIWHELHERGGAAAMAAFLASLRAERMTAVMRADPIYQLSLGSPQTAGAYLGEGNPRLRSDLESAAAAAAGRELSPDERAAGARALEAAGPRGREWLARRALLREVDVGDGLRVVPAFLRRAPDASEALFRLAALSPALAGRAAEILSWAASAPDGMRRVFEEPGPGRRFMSIVAAAESLPWTAEAKRVWDAAVMRWIAAK